MIYNDTQHRPAKVAKDGYVNFENERKNKSYFGHENKVPGSALANVPEKQ